MTEQAKLFYAAKEKYTGVTAQDVEDYYKTQSVTENEYTYTKEKDVYVISKGEQVISRIKGTDATVDAQIQQMKETEKLNMLLDGLLQYVYEKLKISLVK